MARKSRITADGEQRKGLQALARSRDRGEAEQTEVFRVVALILQLALEDRQPQQRRRPAVVGDEVQRQGRLVVRLEVGPIHGDDDRAALADHLGHPGAEHVPYDDTMIAEQSVDLLNGALGEPTSRLSQGGPDLTAYRDVETAYRITLKSLARRYLELHDEIADLDAMIAAIVDELAPNLVARNSIGHTGAAKLLLTAGDNPERLRSEASFASLCGVSPVPASSGKIVRHRLNRGGDRAANSASHIIAIGRLRTDQRTKDYVARRMDEGHSKLDAIRALKRYLAREVFTLTSRSAARK
jgi:Transposase IS116/IS110/IS902 family